MRTAPHDTLVLWSLRAAFAGLVATASVACFSEDATLGLPCTQDGECGDGQVCDSGFCVSEGQASQSGGPTSVGPGTASEGSTTGIPCEPMTTECSEDGKSVLQCNGRVYEAFDCAMGCAQSEMLPAGACIISPSSGDPVCSCADATGGSCNNTDLPFCNTATQVGFCRGGTEFFLNCSTVCEDDGFAVAGPCDAPTGQCECFDGTAGTCDPGFEGQADCLDTTNVGICLSGTIYRLDCAALCSDSGFTTGVCNELDGICDCV
jgi:hypothetical protein